MRSSDRISGLFLCQYCCFPLGGLWGTPSFSDPHSSLLSPSTPPSTGWHVPSQTRSSGEVPLPHPTHPRLGPRHQSVGRLPLPSAQPKAQRADTSQRWVVAVGRRFTSFCLFIREKMKSNIKITVDQARPCSDWFTAGSRSAAREFTSHTRLIRDTVQKLKDRTSFSEMSRY